MFMLGKFMFLNNHVLIKIILAQWNSNNAPHFTNSFCHELFSFGYLKYYIAPFFNMN